jgi:hypothetical protein
VYDYSYPTVYLIVVIETIEVNGTGIDIEIGIAGRHCVTVPSGLIFIMLTISLGTSSNFCLFCFDLFPLSELVLLPQAQLLDPFSGPASANLM